MGIKGRLFANKIREKLSGHRNEMMKHESGKWRGGTSKGRAVPRENIDKTRKRAKKRLNEISEEPTKKNKISRLRENQIGITTVLFSPNGILKRNRKSPASDIGKRVSPRPNR
jgi:hypothetical protein